MKAEAKRLYDLGLNVLPVKGGTKAPTIGWMGYQTEKIPWEVLSEALDKEPGGLAVIAGEVSQNLAILDFDDAEAYHRWNGAKSPPMPSLPVASTGRGFHVFIRLESPLNGKLRIIGETEPCGDLLGTKKLAVLPPTLHPSGFERKWVQELNALPPVVSLKSLGLEVVRSIETQRESLTPSGSAYLEGSRHDALVSYAGKLRNSNLDSEEILSALLALNSRRCSPPLPTGEVRQIAEWVATKEVHSLKGIERDDDGVTPLVHHDLEPIGNEESEEFGGMFLPLPEYLLQAGPDDLEWLVTDLLPVGYLVIVGGTSKVGKSCFLTSLACHIADGRDFLGKATQSTPVLWCALEESEGERRLALTAYDGEPENLFITHEKIYIDSKAGIAALRYWVRRTGAKLVIIDPLYAANTAESLTDGATARRVLQPLKDLCREEGTSAILVHHLNKNNGAGMDRSRMADSNQLLASVSMDILMDAEERGDGSREITLKCRGRGEFANQSWVIHSKGMGDYELLRHGANADSSREATDSAILGTLKTGEYTSAQIAELAQLNLGTVNNRLTDLCRRRRVRTVGKDGRANIYGLEDASG